MKKVKTYNNFINESIRNKMKGKEKEEIMKSVENLSDEDALNKFCGYNYDPGIKHLIKKGLPYNKLITLIIRYCSFDGNLDMIKFIVDKGNISIKDIDVNKSIFNPLTIAVENGNFEIVKYLVENGIKINNWNNGPLSTSISKGYYDIFMYLIDHGAKLESKGQDLIKYAIKSGNLDIVKYLLNKGFTISDDKKYKLFNDAVYSKNPGIVKLMFEKFNINIKNNQLLFESIKYNIPFEIISLLHYYKPKQPNKQIHGSDRTPKYIKSMSIGDISESAVLSNCLDCIKYLIEEKNGIEYLDDVVLNWSSYMGYYDIVKYLIDNDLIDSFWNIKRAIELAKLNNQKDIIELLNNIPINESLKNKMVGKSDNEIKNKLKSL